MGQFGFFSREAFRTLARNGAPSVAAIVTTGITILVLGVLLPLFFFTQKTSQGVRDQLSIKAFLYDDATHGEITALQSKIEGLPGVKSAQFVSKAAAANIIRDRLKDPNILKELNSNPLPASFTILPTDAAHLENIRQELTPINGAGKPKAISPIISEVKDSREQAGKIEQVTSKLKIVLILLTALLCLASLLLIANTIRLSIYARRREVEVMRLVGATRWFIRWPFMIEGVIVGCLGGLAAILLLWLGKLIVVDPLANTFTFVKAQTNTELAFPLLIVLLFITAMVVSAIGSGVTLRRFLKV